MALLSTSGSDRLPVDRSSVPLPYWPCCLRGRQVCVRDSRAVAQTSSGCAVAAGPPDTCTKLRRSLHAPPKQLSAASKHPPHSAIAVHSARSKDERQGLQAAVVCENGCHAAAGAGAGSCVEAVGVLQLNVAGGSATQVPLPQLRACMAEQ